MVGVLKETVEPWCDSSVFGDDHQDMASSMTTITMVHYPIRCAAISPITIISDELPSGDAHPSRDL